MRTDGRARSNLGASIAPGGARDEVAVVRDLKVPLAVLHGEAEQLVNGGYFASIAMPTLWRGAVQVIPGAGHTPQWETPEAFDALLARSSKRRREVSLLQFAAHRVAAFCLAELEPADQVRKLRGFSAQANGSPQSIARPLPRSAASPDPSDGSPS